MNDQTTPQPTPAPAPKCEHTHMTIDYKLYAMETRFEPAEYIGHAWCDNCGQDFSDDDIPEGTMVREGKSSNYEMWA